LSTSCPYIKSLFPSIISPVLTFISSNQEDNISSNDAAKLYHSQHNATATLEIADHNNRVG